jgi:serine/threonine protein kinase
MYKFDKLLGSGSFGFVVGVEDVSNGQKLALKVSDRFNYLDR